MKDTVVSLHWGCVTNPHVQETGSQGENRMNEAKATGEPVTVCVCLCVDLHSLKYNY